MITAPAIVTLQRASVRPLLSIDAAKAILNRDEDAILALIESGRIAWAFDIRSPGAARSCVRIYRDSVFNLLPTTFSATGPRATLQDVIGEVLPKPRGESIASPSLAIRLNCSSTHVHQLARAGSFHFGRPKAGQTAPVEVDRASVETFLTRAVLS